VTKRELEESVKRLERQVADLQARPVYIPYPVIEREGMTQPVYTPCPSAPSYPWMPPIVTC
jgi:hypothetical protein